MERSQQIIQQLQSLQGSPQKRETLQSFFKTGKGQYAEGDQFIGVTVPNIRQTAKSQGLVDIQTIENLILSPWHEARLCALFLLIQLFRKNKTQRTELFNFYLSHTSQINNWDLVDLSAPQIVGTYLTDKPRNQLYQLAASPSLWERRIAIVSTVTFIRNNDFDDTLRLVQLLINDPESLIHKATGWMLREIGKHHEPTLIQFLNQHATALPRTALRYSIERLSPELRNFYLKLR